MATYRVTPFPDGTDQRGNWQVKKNGRRVSTHVKKSAAKRTARRKADTTAVSPLGPHDGASIQSLWRECFPPVEPREHVIERVTTAEERDWVGHGARHRGDLVGFGLMTYTDEPADLYGLPASTFDGDSPAAAFYLTCVHPQHRHDGLGTRLGAKRVEHARERGVDRVVGIAWQAGEYIYRRLGFEKVDTVSDYYDHDPGAVTVWRRWC